jgi:hypothetical protein
LVKDRRHAVPNPQDLPQVGQPKRLIVADQWAPTSGVSRLRRFGLALPQPARRQIREMVCRAAKSIRRPRTGRPIVGDALEHAYTMHEAARNLSRNGWHSRISAVARVRDPENRKSVGTRVDGRRRLAPGIGRWQAPARAFREPAVDATNGPGTGTRVSSRRNRLR